MNRPFIKIIPRYYLHIILLTYFLSFLSSSLWGKVSFGKEGLPEVHLNEIGISSSGECVKCHEDIYKTWKNSLHSMSIRDPVFWTSYLKVHYENDQLAMKTCLSCHAPITGLNQDLKLTREITREGINCNFCHSISEIVQEKNQRNYKHDFGLLMQGPLTHVESKVHKTKFNKLYTQSQFCSGCHELETEKGIKLLETFSEWEQGPYPKKGTQCQNCHMRKIPGKIVKEEVLKDPGSQISTHNIAGGHSFYMRARALGVSIKDVHRFKQKVTVKVEVTNLGAGHKIPTGLPTKKLILRLSLQTGDEESKQEKERIYQKVLVDKDGNILTNDSDIMMGKGTAILSDNRIAPLETRGEEFVFFAPENQPLNIYASVYYSYSPELIQISPVQVKIQEVQKLIEP